mmetsp:Transcript_26843/g.57890  ORF Transcript_26843/g.57890 Transcript_26843/m.57890 type:complete len:581 (+) Transcript_26843:64-1806(+)
MMTFANKIRISFLLVMLFGTILISREYVRHENIILYQDRGSTETSILLRDGSFVNQPFQSSTKVETKTRTITNKIFSKNARATLSSEKKDDTDDGTADPLAMTQSRSIFEQNPPPIEHRSLFNITRPNDNNTAIVLVAMGKVSNTWLTERCVRSIRVGGQFKGTILVLTDKEGYAKYSETLHRMDNSNGGGKEVANITTRSDKYFQSSKNQVIVMEGRKEDKTPKTKDGAEIRHFKKRMHMLYKRYKTLSLKYLRDAFDNDRGVGETPLHVLYLDVDNIITRPLSKFFDDYYDSIRIQLEEAQKKTVGSDGFSSDDDISNATTVSINNHNNTDEKKSIDDAAATDFDFFSFWRDPHTRTKKKTEHLWQGGQIMLSTKHSARCLDAWRHEMDHTKHVIDQALLWNVYTGNFTKHRCRIFELPSGVVSSTRSNKEEGDDNAKANEPPAFTSNRHFQLFSPGIAGSTNRSDYPTIVHLTKARLKRVDKRRHDQFLKHSLYLEEETTNRNRNANSSNGKRKNHLETQNQIAAMDSSAIKWNGARITWEEIVDSFVSLERKKKERKEEKETTNKIEMEAKRAEHT